MLKFFRPNSPSPSAAWSDETLLDAYVRSGEARFLGILYERYMPMVYGVAVKILRDPGRAEDAVMAIYETLVHKAREHRVEAFRGWLYVLTRNHCLMEWRKQQRRPTDLHAPDELGRLGDAAEAAFEFELPQASTPLEKCLGELPAQQHRSVRLFYYEEKSYREIAEMLDENVGKVRSYIQNGRRNLKNCLERENDLSNL